LPSRKRNQLVSKFDDFPEDIEKFGEPVVYSIRKEFGVWRKS